MARLEYKICDELYDLLDDNVYNVFVYEGLDEMGCTELVYILDESLWLG